MGDRAPQALPATEVLVSRIGWLIRLRWVAVVGSFLFIEVGRHLLPIRVFVVPLYAVLGVLALYNLGAWLILRRGLAREGGGVGTGPAASGGGGPGSRHPGGATGGGKVTGDRQAAGNQRPAAFLESLGEPVGGLAWFLLPRTPPGVKYYDRQAAGAALLASAQIVLDLLFLALLLHYAGGIENPLRVFFVFHVIIASILLSRHATYAVATLGVLLLSVVALGEMWGWLPHYSLEGHWRSAGYLELGLVGTQLFLLAVTLYVAAYLASSIAARLRRRELDVVVLTRHLTEEARRLEEAYAELRVAERAKSQYMRKVAHELREPLGTVKTALAVVLDSAAGGMSQRTRDLIQRAERRAGELAEMTHELLALSRAQGGRAVADLVPVNPAEVAGLLLEELQARAEEAGVSFLSRFQDPLPVILGDPEGLADLVVNLVGNAVRYTPPGGRVELILEAREGRLAMEVTDTGIGIREKDLPRIFEEFYRAPQAREHSPQGSGLGLSIVKAVVEQHRGTIEVQSREGEGTRIRVEIPPAP